MIIKTVEDLVTYQTQVRYLDISIEANRGFINRHPGHAEFSEYRVALEARRILFKTEIADYYNRMWRELNANSSS